MSKQDFILHLLQEGREYLKILAPFLTTIAAWFLPSPIERLRKKQ